MIIYTDGSSRGNPGPGGWGAIMITDTKVIELGGREDHTTNNRMELMAAIESLRKVDTDEAITIYADSEYVVKGMTLWTPGWQARGWKTAAKKPVLNQDLWQDLIAVSKGKNISWKTVPAHQGIALNERADTIATSVADQEPIELYSGDRKGYGIPLV